MLKLRNRLARRAGWVGILFMSSLTASAAFALPVSITSGTGSFSINWDANPPHLTADALVTVNSWSDTALDLTFDLTNTTALGGTLTQASLMSLGLTFDPTVTGASLTPGTEFTGLTLDTNFPGGFHVDVCTWTGNNCSGGSINDGLLAGASDSFELLLSRSATGADQAWTLNEAPVKYQTNLGSFEFDACVPGQNCGGPPVEIPEPGTLALLGAVFLGLGAARRHAAS